MATFEAQVEGLTGLAIDGSSSPTQDELSQFLKDGVQEVTSRLIQLRISEPASFSRMSSEQTDNGFNPGSAHVIQVLRETGTDGDFRGCRRITEDLKSRVTDDTSIHYASKYSPAYLITQNRNVQIKNNY